MLIIVTLLKLVYLCYQFSLVGKKDNFPKSFSMKTMRNSLCVLLCFYKRQLLLSGIASLEPGDLYSRGKQQTPNNSHYVRTITTSDTVKPTIPVFPAHFIIFLVLPAAQ